MKRNSFITVVLVLMLGVMLGGGLVTHGQDWPLVRDLISQENSLTTNDDSSFMTAAGSTSVNIGPTNIADMVEKVGTAVVNIETRVSVTTNNPFFNDPFFREFFGDSMRQRTQVRTGIGTGSIITDTGYILTNYHVVEGAESISVTLIGSTKPLPASLVGYDDQLDLAVLKINAGRKLPYLTLGNSDNTRVGDWVVAIGNPYGLDHTVTAGVISAKERPISIEGRQYKNLIQTDAAINPGNSGGPLLNTRGEVIAINTAVNAQAQGIGFAIPINTAKDVLNQLISKGKVVRPYLGVYLRDLSSELADYLGVVSTKGTLVADIMPGSPADKAGIKAGDIILEINGMTINNSTDLTERISKMSVGQKVELKILRDKKTITINLTLEEKP
ncbi:MAG: PDZ domain-containing protein [Syntrophomonadaceae bacterium]|jgi:serine protease Do|nr:PDZ domain-containing protein [Syntrophomonadaceae bacterium]